MDDAGRTSLGLDANLAGALAYALGWLSGLALYFTERENSFVRFHAIQSSVVFGALCALWFVGLSIPIFGFAVVALGLLGFKVGASKRDSMIGMFGGHAGMAPPSKAASAYPKILDTSVAIDGRIVDVVRAGFLHGEIYLTTPVIGELQGFADAGDDVRRSKGRRGLEVLEAGKPDHFEFHLHHQIDNRRIQLAMFDDGQRDVLADRQ